MFRGARRFFAVLGLFCATGGVAQDLELERFVDGVMTAQMQEPGRFVGATVAVVQNGRLALAKGYGVSDLDTGRRVDQDTLFRIGSVSKIFVWMAVLQQVEVGNLQLDEPVNGHLDGFQLNSQAFQPVTLRHLMTHTAGFEDKLVGLFAPGRSEDANLGSYLSDINPVVLYPPGELTAYSNYGAGLAALLVEKASNTVWHDYVDSRLFRPMGLASTTMRQVPPVDLRDRLATGYQYVDGVFEAQPFEFIMPEPAGSATSSARDMARLMIELMSSRGSSGLDIGAKRLMLTRAFTTHPNISGMTLGLYEHGDGGVGHSGSTLWFHSALQMWPAQNLGMFVSFNSDRGAIARTRFVKSFERQYGLTKKDPVQSSPIAIEDYEGFFLPVRYPASSHLKITRLLSTVHIAAYGDDQLMVRGRGAPQRFLPRSDTFFVGPNADDRLGFVRVDNRTDRLYFDATPMMAYERAGWLDRADVSVVLLAFVGIVYTLILLWPFGWLIKRRRRRTKNAERLASTLAVMTASIFVAFFVGIGGVADDTMRVLSRTDPTLYALLWFPVVAGALAMLQAVLGFRAFLGGYWWFKRRVHFGLLSLANLLLVVWCLHWRLLPVELQSFWPV